MQYCKTCVQPDTRPGITFDADGVCNPCRYYANQPKVDWVERKQQIKAIGDWARVNTKSEYDCIVSVSGGKDSLRLALYARDELDLNPLLVSTVASPQHQTDIGTSNLANLVSLGFDMVTVAPAPEVWRKLMLKGFLEYGNYCKSTELALYASAPRFALAYGIPLIFLGENNTLVYGETGAGDDGGDASNMRNYNTLGGGKTDWMLDEDIFDHQLIPYIYPEADALADVNIRIVYLGFYIENFNNYVNGRLAIKNGLQYRNHVPLTDTGCLYPYGAVDDDFVAVNQMIKHMKFGFGKATDEICELIRLGQISREHGFELVQQLDGKCHPRYIKMFCDYLNISEGEFWEIAEQYRNHDLWEEISPNDWRLSNGASSLGELSA